MQLYIYLLHVTQRSAEDDGTAVPSTFIDYDDARSRIPDTTRPSGHCSRITPDGTCKRLGTPLPTGENTASPEDGFSLGRKFRLTRVQPRPTTLAVATSINLVSQPPFAGSRTFYCPNQDKPCVFLHHSSGPGHATLIH